jgi:GNAT superfamily N-acetyltransferase
MAPALDPVVQIRPYRDRDEPGVLRLLQAAFGGWPSTIEAEDPAELFRWKHVANPSGRSVMVVAEAEGAVIGFGAWLRWRVTANGQTFEVLRAVDLAVDRAYRGQGVYGELVQEAIRQFPPDIAFTLNAPNQLSRAGSLGVGGRELGVFPLFVRLRAPLRSAVRLIGEHGLAHARDGAPPVDAESVAGALRDGEYVSALLSRIGPSDARFTTVRDLDYLAWRYGGLGIYRAIREGRDGRLAGLAIFRIRRRGRFRVAVVCELLVAHGDRAVARRLLRRVARAAAVDYIICHFPSGSAARQAAILFGFVRVPWGPAPTVRRVQEQLDPDPTERDSWAICLGDLDLF